MSTSRSSSPPTSKLIFHERFGARSVRLPLFISENVGVANSTPSLLGRRDVRWRRRDRSRHSASRASPGASTGSSGVRRSAGQPVTWTRYMGSSKNSALSIDAAQVLFHGLAGSRRSGTVARRRNVEGPASESGSRSSASNSAEYSAFVRSEASPRPSCLVDLLGHGRVRARAAAR